MLSDFAEKKEKHNFSKSKKSYFFKGDNPHAFGQKCQLFGLFRFGQNKTRNNA